MKLSDTIPATLEEVLEQLINFINAEDEIYFKQNTEDKVLASCHFGIGMHIRNEWQLWHDGPLVKWFNNCGIHHADDMSGIILTSLWRRLNNKDINLEPQVNYYKDYWKKNGTAQ